MKRLLCLAAVLALAGCGDETSPGEATPAGASPPASAAPAGCAASGLDAMSTMAEFEKTLQAAKDAGKITLEQLLATREKLFQESQALAAKDDWAGYCKLIEDTRAALGL